nr:MAG TPA: Protein of unknown function (DUF1192) [Caudoviricetes sp.]
MRFWSNLHNNQPTGDDLSKMSYDELCKYMEENPDAVLE